jgi:hypothetical protein
MRLTIAVVLSALALTFAPATPATARDSGGPLQHPLQLDRGPAPRVLAMVGNQIRFADGRTVAFTPPAGVTGHARLIGRFRDDAVVWAPYGPGLSAVFKVRPSGRVTRLGEPWRDRYQDTEWQIAGDVLYVAGSDARFRTRLAKVSLVDGTRRRTWISAKNELWTLLDVTPHRAAIGNGGRLEIWRGDGTFEVVWTQAGNRYADVRFASLRHGWFANATSDGTELRRISAPGEVVWKQGYENEMIPFDISGDGSVLLTTEFETYSPQLRDARTGRVLRSYQGGYESAYNDNEQLVLEGGRAFLVVMNLRLDGKHREVLVRCTLGGRCERASRVAWSISLVTYGS